MVIVTICACGCGELTNLAPQRDRKRGLVKGQPMRFVWGHAGGAPPKTRPDGVPTPCECGCGQLAPLAQTTNPKAGWIKGQPLRFVHGHSKRIPGETPQDRAERKKAATKAWRAANPEKMRAMDRRKREKNPEGHRANSMERYRKLREMDPERIRMTRRVNAARRRARMRGLEIEQFTHREVWERDEGVCGICGGLADPADWHMDHIVPIAKDGPHTLANVQVSHPFCNRQKGAKAPSPTETALQPLLQNVIDVP